jgi:hypothetical protein
MCMTRLHAVCAPIELWHTVFLYTLAVFCKIQTVPRLCVSSANALSMLSVMCRPLTLHGPLTVQTCRHPAQAIQ